MNRESFQQRFPSAARPWRFLGWTLAITWGFQFGMLAIVQAIERELPVALALLPSLAPTGVALWLLYRYHDAAYRRDYWRRIFDLRRIGRGWWLVILLFHPLKSLLAAGLDRLGGGTGIAVEAAATFVSQPLMIMPLLLFWLFFGPVPEELGWRGYALDGLQARLHALPASLILGGIWAFWHVPLYFVPGTFQAEQVGWLSERFWIFMLSIVLEAVLYTWIFNNTGRSTLAAILFHFAGNAFGEAFALSPVAERYTLLISLIAVIVVVLIWKPATLMGRSSPTPSALDSLTHAP